VSSALASTFEDDCPDNRVGACVSADRGRRCGEADVAIGDIGSCYPYFVSPLPFDMEIRFHPHALERLLERGATEEEVIRAIESGERFQAKFGRMGFRRNFAFDGEWNGKRYATKQVEALVAQDDGWLVITVVVKFF